MARKTPEFEARLSPTRRDGCQLQDDAPMITYDRAVRAAAERHVWRRYVMRFGFVHIGTERARYQLMALSLESGVDHLASERRLMVSLPGTPTLAGRLSPTGRVRLARSVELGQTPLV
jgi:hypothetical protein